MFVDSDVALRFISVPVNLKGLTIDVNDLDHHFIFGNGTCFIDRDDSGLSKRFHRLQTFDQGVSLAHSPDSRGQYDGNGNR